MQGLANVNISKKQDDNLIKLTDNQVKLIGKPENYSFEKYSKIKDFEINNDLLEKFIPIAKKLNLSQNAVEMLLDIALEMSEKQNAFSKEFKEKENSEKFKSYNKLFLDDKELPNPNSDEIKDYMNVADIAFSEFASDKLKELFNETGLCYHPELIKMFHKIGELLQEDNLNYNGSPVNEELTPAQILYGLKD